MPACHLARWAVTCGAWEGGVAVSSAAVRRACAPRYVYYPNTREERHDPVGTCWVAQERFARFNEYSPCRTNGSRSHEPSNRATLVASAIHHQAQLQMDATNCNPVATQNNVAAKQARLSTGVRYASASSVPRVSGLANKSTESVEVKCEQHI
ncbi:Integrin alpha-PS2 [Gryllus bimaculatus]|nr:Integrin alpha-PS2 [Gryllus bimaculatus]